MKRYYYSAESDHGSESSFGFDNDTTVLVWSSKSARDRYVSESENLSCRAIKRMDVTKEAANYDTTSNELIRPQPFSSDYWGIDDAVTWVDEITGLVGEIAVCNDWRYKCPRFYS